MVDIAVLLSGDDAMLKAVLRPGGDDHTLAGGGYVIDWMAGMIHQGMS